MSPTPISRGWRDLRSQRSTPLVNPLTDATPPGQAISYAKVDT